MVVIQCRDISSDVQVLGFFRAAYIPVVVAASVTRVNPEGSPCFHSGSVQTAHKQGVVNYLSAARAGHFVESQQRPTVVPQLPERRVIGYERLRHWIPPYCRWRD